MQLYTPVEYFQTRWVRKISSIGILSGSTMSTLKITRWLIAANVTKMINQKHQLPETNRPSLHGQRPKVMRMLPTLYRKWPSYRSWFRNAARALRTWLNYWTKKLTCQAADNGLRMKSKGTTKYPACVTPTRTTSLPIRSSTSSGARLRPAYRKVIRPEQLLALTVALGTVYQKMNPRSLRSPDQGIRTLKRII